MERVTVIGAGYVGLVTAACLAELGHRVTCVETNSARLRALGEGRAPFHEPGLAKLIATNVQRCRLDFAATARSSVRSSTFTFLAVQTPSNHEGETTLEYLFAAVEGVASALPRGAHLVIKSTVPVGTADRVQSMLQERGIDVQVISNPEFLRQGAAIDDFLHPHRIVVGVPDAASAEAVARLFEGIHAPVIHTTRVAAELGKYASNALLATRISFMNEIALMCEKRAIDVTQVSEIVGSDARLGNAYLRAGLGWGGSCLPKDIRALMFMARADGLEPAILVAVDAVNEQQKERTFIRLRDAAVAYGSQRPLVAVLGLSFKPNTDDTRGSPSLDVIGKLLTAGIGVTTHDPAASSQAHARGIAIRHFDSPYDAVAGAHALLVATEWKEYEELDWHRVRSVMAGRTVIDGRNFLDGQALRRLGFQYISFGSWPHSMAD